jgi:hypothetical protein
MNITDEDIARFKAGAEEAIGNVKFGHLYRVACHNNNLTPQATIAWAKRDEKQQKRDKEQQAEIERLKKKVADLECDLDYESTRDDKWRAE